MVFEDQYQNGTLGLAAGIAQGAANFMSARNAAQQQQFKNNMDQQELDAKRELYQLQAQKLKKELEPVQINLEKVKAARDYFGDDSSFYKKAVNDTMNAVTTPAQAQYLSSMAGKNPGGGQPGIDVSQFNQPGPSDGAGGSAMFGNAVSPDFKPQGQLPGGDVATQFVPPPGMAPVAPMGNDPASQYSIPQKGAPIPQDYAPAQRQLFTGNNYGPRQIPVLNKGEADLFEKMISNDSSNNYKQGMLGQKSDELDRNRQKDQAEFLQKANELSRNQAKDNADFLQKRQDLELKSQEARHKAENDALQRQHEVDRIALEDRKEKNTSAVAQQNADSIEQARKDRAAHDKEDERIRREEIAAKNARARARAATSKAPMDETALNSGISDDYKALNKITTAKPGLMDDADLKDTQAAQIKSELNQKLDRWKATHNGIPHSLDLRPVVAPVAGGNAGAGIFGDGRLGPVAPSAAPIGVQTGGKIRVQNLQTGQAGSWDLSKGKPDPTKYKVLGQ